MTDATILLIPGLLCDRIVWDPLIDALDGKAEVADLSTQDSLTQMAQDCLDAHPGPCEDACGPPGARWKATRPAA